MNSCLARKVRIAGKHQALERQVDRLKLCLIQKAFHHDTQSSRVLRRDDGRLHIGLTAITSHATHPCVVAGHQVRRVE